MKLDRKTLLGLLILAAVLRLVWVVACPVVLTDDAYAYDAFARTLAGGGGYGWKPGEPSLFWAPGTSFVYAALYVVFGHVFWPILALNVVLGVVVTWVSAVTALRLYGPRVAFYTALLLAIWPAQVQFASLLQSEVLFEALFGLAFFAWLALPKPWQQVLVAGLLLSAASYVRPLAMLAPLLFAWVRYGPKRELKAGLLSMAGCFLVLYLGLLPWALRNQAVSGRLVWVSANSGTNFWMGNNPESTGEYMHPPPEVHGLSDLERDDRLKEIARSYVQAEPVAFVLRSAKKLIKLHDRETIGVVWNGSGLSQRYGEGVLGPLKLASTLFWWLVLGLSGYGLWLLIRRYRWQVLFQAPLVFWSYFAVVHAVIVVMDRYHFPSVPFIAMLAGLALTQGLDKGPPLAFLEQIAQAEASDGPER